MAYHCYKCDQEFSEKRAALGYKLCLECGDAQAQQVKKQLAKCTAPLWPKGAYQLIINVEDLKTNPKHRI